jgi:membrane protein implicated in regulation of membrane protease activity
MKVIPSIATGILLVWIAAWTFEQPPVHWVSAYVLVVLVSWIAAVLFISYRIRVEEKKYKELLKKYNLEGFNTYIEEDV